MFRIGAIALGLMWAGTAQAADYYDGKKLTLVVGGDVGGGYDTYARAISRHLARFIPGKPTIIVQNMPGAGSIKAAEYTYSIAPKDGTVVATLFPGAVVEPLMGDGSTTYKYDATKFAWIGTADSGTRVCGTFQSSKVKTMEDAKAAKAIIGASAAGGSTRDYGWVLNNLVGTKFEIISGYKGTADITLAVERGEVDGLCGFDWSSLKSQKSDWIKNKQFNIMVQMSLEPDAELTKMGVPHLWQFVSGENRKVAEFIVAQQVFGRPYAAPPGTNEAAVGILRKAFMDTMKDSEFLADAEKARLSIDAMGGEQVQKVVTDLYASPKDIVAKAAKAIKPPGG
jgi:tripartite-type tricarboxylate transporter receptor subunit TctC